LLIEPPDVQGCQPVDDSLQSPFFQKFDIAKTTGIPVQHEEVELCRRMFLFSVFTGLAFSDMQSLRASHIEMNGEGRRYIRKTR